MGAGASGAERPKPDHEQCQAQAVTEEPHQEAGPNRRRRRPIRPAEQRQGRVAGARHKALEAGNEHRVISRHLARQVVVDGPAKSGAEDEQGSGRKRRATGFPGKQHPAGNDGRHTEDDLPVGVLLEHEPGDDRGQDTLDVQQE